jgi:hypothetical protein
MFIISYFLFERLYINNLIKDRCHSSNYRISELQQIGRACRVGANPNRVPNIPEISNSSSSSVLEEEIEENETEKKKSYTVEDRLNAIEDN